MIEFLIRPVDSEWFDLRCEFSKVFHPNVRPWKAVEGYGNFRFETSGCEVSVSDEEVGYQISIEGDIGIEAAREIVEDILLNLQAATQQHGRIVEL